MADEQISGVSRRRLLQGTALGVVGAWAAPVVTSVAPAAGAASAVTCDCGGQQDCAIGNCGDPKGGCSCAVTVDGSCACFVPDCGNFTACTSNADCGPGAACAENCCGSPVCAPLCDPSTAGWTGAQTRSAAWGRHNGG
jgi:hypothetical protein